MKAPRITPAAYPVGYVRGEHDGDPRESLPTASLAAALPADIAPVGTQTDPPVPCDGDGTTGARVQGLYVRWESSRAGKGYLGHE